MVSSVVPVATVVLSASGCLVKIVRSIQVLLVLVVPSNWDVGFILENVG